MHIPDIFQYLCEFRVCGLFSFHIQNEFVAKFVVTTDYVIYLVTCSFVKHMLLYFSDDCVCNIFIVQFSLLYLRNISLCSVPRMLSLLFGTYILICIRQDATLFSLFIFGNCSTCFGWYLHPSSVAHTTVSTASGRCQTVPDAVDTVVQVCAPDDGWRYHTKHVEQFPDINKLCYVASCWIYIGMYLRWTDS